MFCTSDSCDSAICRSPEPRSRPLVMEAFYFLYSPFPLFTRVRGRLILRPSPVRCSPKQQLCLAASHVGKETFQIHDAGRYPPPLEPRPAFFLVLAASGLF